MILEGWQKFRTDVPKHHPQMYYHVTSGDNIEGIKTEGIRGSTQAGDRDYGHSAEDAKEKRVYLFASEETAYMAAFARPDSGIFGGAEPPFIFVKVDLAQLKPPPKVYDDLELPDFDAYYVVGDVPPHVILDVKTEATVADRLGGDDYDDDDEYALLNEAEEEKLRVFEVELVIKIRRRAGIDDTLADIRSIPGVTIVSSLASQRSGDGFVSTIKVKFHPSKEAMTGQTYVKQTLIPTINSREIPGCIVMRYIPRSLRPL